MLVSVLFLSISIIYRAKEPRTITIMGTCSSTQAVKTDDIKVVDAADSSEASSRTLAHALPASFEEEPSQMATEQPSHTPFQIVQMPMQAASPMLAGHMASNTHDGSSLVVEEIVSAPARASSEVVSAPATANPTEDSLTTSPRDPAWCPMAAVTEATVLSPVSSSSPSTTADVPRRSSADVAAWAAR